MEKKQRIFSSNVCLSGHEGPVYSIKFNSAGNLLASGGHDKNIFLWDIYNKCRNFSVIRGHKNAVLDMKWSNDDTQIITASADKTVGMFDITTEKKTKKFVGHEAVVNSIDVSKRGLEIIASVSDDNTIKLWDSRYKDPIHTFDTDFPVLSVSFNETADRLFTSGN